MPRIGIQHAAVAVALGLLLVGVMALLGGQRLQSRLDMEQALDAVMGDLQAGPDAGVVPIETRLRRRVLAADSGFVHLHWEDRRHGLRVDVSRADGFALPLLREQWARRAAGALIGIGAVEGERPLVDSDGLHGVLRYAYRDPLRVDVRESALRQLRLTGVAVIGLSLLFVLLLFALRRTSQAEAAGLARRLAPVEPPPLHAAASGAEAPAVSRHHFTAAMEELDIGVMVVDAERRIRFINAAAASLCGWSRGDATGRLVYSVFHPLSEDEQPQATPAERALAEDRALSGLELGLRARGGSVRPVEVDAAAVGSGESRIAVMLFRDISQRRRAMRAASEQLERAQAMLDALPDALVRIDSRGQIIETNARAEQLFGYARAELVGTSASRLMPVPFMNSPGIRFGDYVGAGPAQRLPRVVGWRRDGSSFPVALAVSEIPGGDGSELLLVVRDDTERRRSESAAMRLGRALDGSRLEVWLVDAQTRRIIECNPAAREATGYSLSEFRTLSYDRLTRPPHGRTVVELFAELRNHSEGVLSVEMSHRRQDGTEYPLRLTLVHARDEDPPLVLVIGEPIPEPDQSADAPFR